MAQLKLHDLELSGNCYKVRLFCSLLGLKLDLVPVDFLAGAHKKSPLIEKNPFGEIPILEEGDVVCAIRRRSSSTSRGNMEGSSGFRPIRCPWDASSRG